MASMHFMRLYLRVFLRTCVYVQHQLKYKLLESKVLEDVGFQVMYTSISKVYGFRNILTIELLRITRNVNVMACIDSLGHIR